MFKALVTAKLAQAGITINGTNPWDLIVKDDRFYARTAIGGSLGLGDSYAEGLITCEDIGALQQRWIAADTHPPGPRWPRNPAEAWIRLKMLMSNQQNIERSRDVGKFHYDIGNDLYRRMLGPTMAYSCGYWAGIKYATDALALDQAQRNKYQIICEKLNLRWGMRVLEIGCGSGGFAAYAAREYGVDIVGVSISKEQIAYAQQAYPDLCASGQINLQLMDYRGMYDTFGQQFDAAVSIGMFEHVGPANYAVYMKAVRDCLKPHAPFLLHTIVGNGNPDPFMWYRIFRGGVLPLEAQMAKAAKPYFAIEHVENFGYDYYLTLKAWWNNFVAAWPELEHTYDRRFYRMWEFYLKACAALFEARRIHLQHWLLVPGGTKHGYHWQRPQYGGR